MLLSSRSRRQGRDMRLFPRSRRKPGVSQQRRLPGSLVTSLTEKLPTLEFFGPQISENAVGVRILLVMRETISLSAYSGIAFSLFHSASSRNRDQASARPASSGNTSI